MDQTVFSNCESLSRGEQLMDRITNILAVVDPTSTEQPAVDKAATLAMKFDARLELLACDTKFARETRAAAQLAKGEAFSASLEPFVNSLAGPLRQRGLDVTTHCIRQDPLHVALCDWMKRSSADLVVKDTHYRSLLKRTFITNTDWYMIRELGLPLLLTKPRSWAEHPRIAAAVDPTHANDKPLALDHRILEYGKAFADSLQGELHALHAYLPALLVAAAMSSAAAPVFTAVPPEALRAEEDAKRKELLALTQPYGVQPSHLHLESGTPSEFLSRVAAECHLDLVVMGAIARSGLKQFYIGSTAERVLQWLPCDVLVVKSPDFGKSLPF